MSSSSVARGGGAEGYTPIGMQSKQNTTFLALFRPIFAVKAKIASHWHAEYVFLSFDTPSLGEDLFFDLFLGKKNARNLVKTFFFVFGNKNRLESSEDPFCFLRLAFTSETAPLPIENS